MPIRPEFRHFYQTEEWRAARQAVLERAGHKCEQCHKPRYTVVEVVSVLVTPPAGLQFGECPVKSQFWRGAGTGWTRCTDGEEFVRRAFERRYRAELRGSYTIWVKIGVAHLDHDPAHNDLLNLRAFCDWCHLHYDRMRHKQTRCERREIEEEAETGPRLVRYHEGLRL